MEKTQLKRNSNLNTAFEEATKKGPSKDKVTVNDKPVAAFKVPVDDAVFFTFEEMMLIGKCLQCVPVGKNNLTGFHEDYIKDVHKKIRRVLMKNQVAIG